MELLSDRSKQMTDFNQSDANLIFRFLLFISCYEWIELASVAVIL
jgi:hypothetical protein